MSRGREPSPLTRRGFLGHASCAAVGATSLVSTLGGLSAAGSVQAGSRFDDDRALVCVFLSGGADSFNMLVPRGGVEHAEYARVRGNLALPASSLVPIAPDGSDGRTFGLHPGLAELQPLFASGRLAFVANVGTLAEPTTRRGVLDGTVRLPRGLYSHVDQISHWQTSVPDGRSRTGWAGRMADALRDGHGDTGLSMNVSLSGTNVFQSGETVVPYAIGPGGSIGVLGYDATDRADAMRRRQVLDAQLDQPYVNLLQRAYAARTRRSIDAHRTFASALDGVEPLPVAFDGDPVSRRLAVVARTIAARRALGLRRQTFFVAMDGWDHHDGLLDGQRAMLPVLARALTRFQAAMDALGLAESVTLFTASDFGRTLTSNGTGSDHGWGGHQLVLGGAVRGRRIVGHYPRLGEGNPLDVGRGRLIPTTAVDELFAELASWFGVTRSQLTTVLPNLDRFWTPGDAWPLGLMRAGPPGP